MSEKKRSIPMNVLSTLALTGMMLGVVTPAMAATGDFYDSTAKVHYTAAGLTGAPKDALIAASAAGHSFIKEQSGGNFLNYTAAYAELATLLQTKTAAEAIQIIAADTTLKAAVDKTQYTEAVPVASALAVSSVSAINASQFTVVFNKAVDKVSAETVSNYKVNQVALVGGTDLAKLQADNVTVIVTVNTAFTNNVGYSLEVVKDVIKDATDSTKTAPVSITSFLANDKAVPTVVSAIASSATNTRTVAVTFNEPITSATSVKIDGVAATVTTAPGTIVSGNSDKITVTAAQDLAAGTSHTISFYNVTDNAANASSSFTPVTANFTVTSDIVAPVLKSVTAYSENKVLLTFDKKVNVATGAFTINSVGVAAGTFTATGAADPNSDNNIVLTIAGISYGTDNTRALVVDAKNVKDLSGNLMTAVTNQAVTLTKDVVKPTFVSNEVASTNLKLFVKFNEDLANNAAVGTAYTLINSKGQDVSANIASSRTLKADKATQAAGPYLEINLTAALAADTYTLSIPASTVTDNSAAFNPLDAYSFSFATSAVTDTTTFTAAVAQGGTNQFTVTYSKAVLGGAVAGSATDPGYYLLDNTTLPTGTTITLDSATSKVATITLPSGSVVAPNTVTLAVSGVKSQGGGTVTANSGSVAIVDNTKPTLVSAEATGATTVVLTFSEPVSVAGLSAGDYVLSDGVSYTAQSATVATAAGTKVTLTVPSMAATTQNAMKITVLAGEISDAAANANIKITNASVADKFVSGLSDLAITDGDTAIAGLNGLDMTPTYTALTDTDVYQYKMYAFVTAGAPTIATAADLDAYSALWTGTTLPTTGTGDFGTSVLTDSEGAALTAAGYDVYVVSSDASGNKKLSNKATVTLTNP